MYHLTFLYLSLWIYQFFACWIVNGKNVSLNIKNRFNTDVFYIDSTNFGNFKVVEIEPKRNYNFTDITDGNDIIYSNFRNSGLKSVKLFYLKWSNKSIIIKLKFKRHRFFNIFKNIHYIYLYDRWISISTNVLTFVINEINNFIPDAEGVLKLPKFLSLNLNNRKSNDAIDVECNEEDDVWNIKFTPKSGHHILVITADEGIIWEVDKDCKLPNEVNVLITDEVVVSLNFKDPKGEKEPEIINFRLDSMLSKHSRSLRNDLDVKKKIGEVKSDVNEDEDDEQGVIEDQYEWTDGVEVTEEEAEKLAEYLQRKARGEAHEEFVVAELPELEIAEQGKKDIEPEADIGEVEGDVIEEGTTSSGEDIESQVDLEEVKESIEEVQQEKLEVVVVEKDTTPSGEDIEHEVDLEDVKESVKVQEPVKDITQGLSYESIDVDDLMVPGVDNIEVDVLLLDPSCYVKRTYGETTHTIAFISPHRAVKVKYGDLLLWESENIDDQCKIIDIFSKNGNDLMVLSILNDKTSSILPGFYSCSRDFECYKFNYENFVYMWNEFKFTFDTIGGIIDYSDYSRVMEIVEPLDELPYGRCGIDDYFKDLKPITLDIYNHETEGLDIKVKQYPNYTSTIHTCRPKNGYILDSLYDSQRNEMLWKRYKNNKYAVVALVDANDLELIVLFVIDVNPQKSHVIYFKYLLLYGWKEIYKEPLTKCYLDTVIKGEWRISDKIL